MNDDCGCCEGIEQLTPTPTANRPGLYALSYRAGTHATFLESMKSRLSSLPWEKDAPLKQLTTREAGDPSLGLLDAWAIVADVLTFYQERMANEGYLRTATQRRSVVELAKLVSYQPRPGVASTVYLAFTVEQGSGEIVIAQGTPAKSIAGPGESQQTFETSHAINARPEWNELRPRLTRPTAITVDNALNISRLYIEGTSTNLKPNDFLVLVIGDARTPVLRKVQSIREDFEKKRSEVALQADVLAVALFVGKVQFEIGNFVREARFADTPQLANEIYGNLRTFVTDHATLGEKLVVVEKKVHDYAAGPNGLDKFQDWSRDVASAFQQLGGAAGTPLRDLRSSLDRVIVTKGPFLSQSDRLATQYIDQERTSSDLQTPLNNFHDTLHVVTGVSRVQARKKATEISHYLRIVATQLRSDGDVALTTAAAPLEHDAGTQPAELDLALHLSRVGTLDSPSANLASEVQIAGNFVSTEDVLAFADTPNIHHSLPSPGTLRLEVAGQQATVADFQAALRRITYQNTNAATPNTSRRTVSFTFFEGNEAKATDLRGIKINGDTSGHIIRTSAPPLKYLRETQPVAIDEGLEISNAPPGTSNKFIATVRIATNFVAAEDQLEFTDTAEITHVAGGQTLQLRIKAGQSVTATQFRDALRTVKYRNTNANPSVTTRTVTITVNTGTFEALAQRDIVIVSKDLYKLHDAMIELKHQIDAKAATFGKTTPKIDKFYHMDPDSLDSSIEKFRTATFFPTISNSVNQIVAALKSEIASANRLSKQAKVVSDKSALLKQQETAASGKVLLANRIRELHQKLDEISASSSLVLANSIQTPKAGYVSSASQILTNFGGPGTPVGAELNRLLQPVKSLVDLLPQPTDGRTFEERADSVETAIGQLEVAEHDSTDLRQGFETLLADLQDLRVQLWRFCVEVRDGFKKRIRDRIGRTLPLLIGAPLDLHAKVTDLDNAILGIPLGIDPPLPPQANSFGRPLEELVTPIQNQLKKDEPNSLAWILERQTGSLGDFGAILRTLVREFQVAVGQVAGVADAGSGPPLQKVTPDIIGLLRQFTQLGSDASRRSRLLWDFKQAFASDSDTILQLAQTLNPSLRNVLYQVWRSLSVELGEPYPEVHALRKRAPLFGYNAPKELTALPDVIKDLKDNIGDGALPPFTSAQKKTVDTNIARHLKDVKSVAAFQEPAVHTGGGQPFPEEGHKLYLDSAYPEVLPGSQIAIQVPLTEPRPFKIRDLAIHPRTAYGISATTTELILTEKWWTPEKDGFEVIRGGVVHAGSEKLHLAEEPVSDDVPTLNAKNQVELDDIYEGLTAGRKLVITGERTDIPGATGVRGTELAEIIGVLQTFTHELIGEKVHTKLILAEDLKYRYRRDTVTIRGNVIHASQGETRSEILGSGDATQAFQQFPLSSSPLTFVSAPTRAGIASSLSVRVNNVQWHESEGFAGRTPTDRIYVLETDHQQRTTVTFGSGEHGSRLPTGLENVAAIYRTGIGKGGNAKAEQISQLAAQPLGVKGVVNPLRASGGADPETRDQARRNASLPVMALDRLVSVRDYADFVRTFAGIGKSSAVRLSDGHRELVHVTVAGAEDIPIAADSDLLRNLFRAVRDLGDPQHSLQLDVRELALLIIDAKIRVMPDYLWQFVERDVRRALLDKFSFERRDLGQDVTLGEVIATIQAVPGVDYVDVNLLHSVGESTTPQQLVSLADTLKAEGDRPKERIRADLAGAKFHEVKEGETLDTIAAIYRPRVDVPDLNRLNPGITDPLTPEKQLLVSRTWPAQIIYLSPDVPDTLILSEIV